MKVGLRIAVSLMLSGVFLYFAARGVSWSEVGATLASAHWIYVLPMIVGTVLPLWFRAVRWAVLVRPLGQVPFRVLFMTTSIGFAVNMLLPLRAGEIARPWLLSRRASVGFSQAMATIALERLFDMATLLLLFAVATLTLPLPPEWRRYGWLFLVAFAVLLVGLFVFHRFPESLLRIVELGVRPLPTRIAEGVSRLARGFGEGLTSLGDPRSIGLAMFHSLGVWLSIGISFGFGLNALEIDVPWLRAAVATTTFVAIAVSVPGGPGFIGMFQAGCVVALGAFGVEKSVAFSYSLLTHAVQFATIVILGVYCLLRDGLRLAELGLAGVPVADEPECRS